MHFEHVPRNMHIFVVFEHIATRHNILTCLIVDLVVEPLHLGVAELEEHGHNDRLHIDFSELDICVVRDLLNLTDGIFDLLALGLVLFLIDFAAEP